MPAESAISRHATSAAIGMTESTVGVTDEFFVPVPIELYVFLAGRGVCVRLGSTSLLGLAPV